MQGMWVRSLVRELRSHMPRGVAKTKQNKKCKHNRHFWSLSEERMSLGQEIAFKSSLTSVFLSYLTSDTSANPISSLFKYIWNPTPFHTTIAPPWTKPPSSRLLQRHSKTSSDFCPFRICSQHSSQRDILKT